MHKNWICSNNDEALHHCNENRERFPYIDDTQPAAVQISLACSLLITYDILIGKHFEKY